MPRKPIGVRRIDYKASIIVRRAVRPPNRTAFSELAFCCIYLETRSDSFN
jgi:hypothetical protein